MKRIFSRMIKISLILLAMAFATAAVASDEDLRHAQKMLNQGHIEQALAVLSTLEPQLAGDKRF